MKEKILAAKEITKTYPGAPEPVLQNISTEIYGRDFTVVMGPSGAGKSTLLYALSGMEPVDSGHVFYKDRDLGSLSEKENGSFAGERIWLCVSEDASGEQSDLV